MVAPLGTWRIAGATPDWRGHWEAGSAGGGDHGSAGRLPVADTAARRTALGTTAGRPAAVDRAAEPIGVGSLIRRMVAAGGAGPSSTSSFTGDPFSPSRFNALPRTFVGAPATVAAGSATVRPARSMVDGSRWGFTTIRPAGSIRRPAPGTTLVLGARPMRATEPRILGTRPMRATEPTPGPAGRSGGHLPSGARTIRRRQAGLDPAGRPISPDATPASPTIRRSRAGRHSASHPHLPDPISGSRPSTVHPAGALRPAHPAPSASPAPASAGGAPGTHRTVLPSTVLGATPVAGDSGSNRAAPADGPSKGTVTSRLAMATRGGLTFATSRAGLPVRSGPALRTAAIPIQTVASGLAGGMRMARTIVPAASAATRRAGGVAPTPAGHGAGGTLRRRAVSTGFPATPRQPGTHQPRARWSAPTVTRSASAGSVTVRRHPAVGADPAPAAARPAGAGWAAATPAPGFPRPDRSDPNRLLTAAPAVRAARNGSRPAGRHRFTDQGQPRRPDSTGSPAPGVTRPGSTRSGLPIPVAVRSIVPLNGTVSRLPSIGSARAISPVANAAGRGSTGPHHVATMRRAATTHLTFAPGKRPSDVRRASGAAGSAPDRRTDALDPTRAAGPPAATRSSADGSAGIVVGRRGPSSGTAVPGPDGPAARLAGLLLRQVIPTAAVIDAATTGVIRRMPPAPPTGTPRLGAHRRDRGPDVPRSADPNWSFTGARGDRALSGMAIGARARGSRSLTVSGPAPNEPAADAVPSVGRSGSENPSSLLDLIPPSLFDRARAAMSDPAAEPSGAPPLTTSREVAVSSPRDDIVPRREQVAEALTPREWDELVDIIVDRLEDRVLDELARRGRRFTPGVF